MSALLLALLGASAESVVDDARPLRSVANPEDVGLYFGAGCFWHVQWELIAAERELLGRSDGELTSVVGYAGGKGPGMGGRACYKSPDSYGLLGHTEVVYVSVPIDMVTAVSQRFWALFKGNGGRDREDVMDKGAEYRACIGVPDESVLQLVNDGQEGFVKQPFETPYGEGSDADTLGVAKVWVYDSTKFPFFLGEVYHQFHDDFMPGGKYPQHYNDLVHAFLGDKRLQKTGCANDGDEDDSQVVIFGAMPEDGGDVVGTSEGMARHSSAALLALLAAVI